MDWRPEKARGNPDNLPSRCCLRHAGLVGCAPGSSARSAISAATASQRSRPASDLAKFRSTGVSDVPIKRPMAALASLPLLIIGGCNNQLPTPAPSRNAVLMVTWQASGQPPQTAQTVLSNMASCEAARRSAIAAGEQARSQREKQNALDKAEALADLERAAANARVNGGVLSGIGLEDKRKLQGEPLPQVSADCIEQ